MVEEEEEVTRCNGKGCRYGEMCIGRLLCSQPSQSKLPARKAWRNVLSDPAIINVRLKDDATNVHGDVPVGRGTRLDS